MPGEQWPSTIHSSSGTVSFLWFSHAMPTWTQFSKFDYLVKSPLNFFLFLELGSIFKCPEKPVKGQVFSPVVALKIGMVQIMEIGAWSRAVVSIVPYLSEHIQVELDQKNHEGMMQKEAGNDAGRFIQESLNWMHWYPAPWTGVVAFMVEGVDMVVKELTYIWEKASAPRMHKAMDDVKVAFSPSRHQNKP